MSGHSKFANIKHKKEKNDAAKGKIFTVIGREIAVAVKRADRTRTITQDLETLLQRQRQTMYQMIQLKEVSKRRQEMSIL